MNLLEDKLLTCALVGPEPLDERVEAKRGREREARHTDRQTVQLIRSLDDE